MTSTSSLNCYHCSLPIEGEPRYFVTIDSSPRAMCCPGCEAVAQSIMQYGLDNYYQYRTEPATQAVAEKLNFQQYDNEIVQESFTHKADGPDGVVRISTLIVEGIHCAACVWLIENTLSHTPGVESSNIVLADHTATIQWNSNDIGLSEIFATIHAIGYSAHPYSADSQHKLFQQENSLALRRLGVAGIAMMQVGMFAIALYAGAFQGIDNEYQHLLRWFSLLIATPVLFYSGLPFFQGALRGIKQRSLNMDTPISIALASAYIASAISTITAQGEVYFDSIAMFVFLLLLARYLEMRSRNRNSALSYQALTPDTCKRLDLTSDGDRSFELIPLHDISSGDTVLVHPGETIPVDGIVTEGSSSVDESSFSGEFIPVLKETGDSVLAGTVNSDGSLLIDVRATGQQASISIIQQLLRKAQQEKPRVAQLADSIARYFTGFVLLVTSLAGIYWYYNSPELAFEICLAMLVVSCPCALSLATPTAITISTNAMRLFGLLVSKGHVLEQTSDITHVVFDKTGTLTRGKLSLVESHQLATLPLDRGLAIASALEAYSEHPVAKAFTTGSDVAVAAEDVSIAAGQGVEGIVNNTRYRIGSAPYCQEWLQDTPEMAELPGNAQPIWLIDENQWLCCFVLNDQLRDDASQALQELRSRGLTVSMLTGDCSKAGDDVAADLGISDYQTGVSAQQKLVTIKAMQAEGKRVMMVGDGINDVPVLATADISIAMNTASDMAKIQADSVLLANKLTAIPHLFEHAAKTRNIIRENISWALLYNGSALPLAACGLIPPYLAAIGMSLSSLLVIINASRLSAHRFMKKQQQITFTSQTSVS